MIVGVANREEDLAVYPRKSSKQYSSSTKDTTIVLKRPKKMSLENYLEFINDDEMVEITPLNIRLRKKVLDTTERKKMDSQKKWSETNK